MANPLSDRGWSDRDYAAAVGTLAGEVAARGGLVDYQAVADVIANRVEAGVYGKSVAQVTMNPREFSTWSPKEKAAYANAKAGFAAALNPSRAASLSPAIRDRVEKAQQAINDVMVTGKARGITQGATAYHNPEVTAKLGTGGWHNMLEDKYGAVTIGAHTFTGKGFRPDDTFDPITYNGQLGAPPSADPYFGDVMFGDLPVNAVPSGWVEASAIPDLSPASAGFSLGGFQPNEAAAPDFSDMGAYDFSGITRGTAFDNLPGFSPAAAATPDFSDFDVGSYPDITAGVFDAPDYAVDAASWDSMPESYGPAMSEMGIGTSGYHSGVDAGPYGYTPDFSAPSEAYRTNEAFGISALNRDAVARSNPSDMWDGAIADRLNNTYGPTAADKARERDRAAMASYSQQKADYDRQMAAYTAATKNFAPTKTGFSTTSAPTIANTSIPATTVPTAGLASFGLTGFMHPVTGVPVGRPAVAPQRVAQTVARPAPVRAVAPPRPVAPTMPRMTAPRVGVEAGWNPGVGSDGWGGYNSGTGGLASIGADTYDWNGAFDSFMNAQTQPQQAGFFDSLTTGWSTPGLVGGAIGLATGGIPGAVLGYAGGKYGSQALGSLGSMFDGWGAGGLFGGSEGYHGGGNNGPNSSLGDGSYAEQSGYSDNNPQGLL